MSVEWAKQMSMVVEVTQGSRIKRNHTGRLDFVSPFVSPFNYGSICDTEAPDGEPEDAEFIGGPIVRGTVVTAKVLGRVKFIDNGVADHKWILGNYGFSDDAQESVASFFERYSKIKRVTGFMRCKTGKTVYLGVELSPVDVVGLQNSL